MGLWLNSLDFLPVCLNKQNKIKKKDTAEGEQNNNKNNNTQQKEHMFRSDTNSCTFSTNKSECFIAAKHLPEERLLRSKPNALSR